MKKILIALFFVVSCGTPAPVPVASHSPTPSPSGPSPVDVCHPARVSYCLLNPAVSPATIKTTICIPGWTSTVRPPVTYTDKIKQTLMTAHQNQHAGDTLISDYELDHRMPLALGGHPRDLSNLSIEYPKSTNPKDVDEADLHNKVCAGTMTLAAAQAALLNKWLLPYPGYKQ